MAEAFPDLWPSHDAARQERARSVTNCYYRESYNSKLSQSSSVVTYRPAGAGQKDRQARFDLAVIPEPSAWLERRLGPLAHVEMLGELTVPALGAGDGMAPLAGVASSTGTTVALFDAPSIQEARDRLANLGARLDAAIHQRIANDRARLTALTLRLDAAKPDRHAA